MTILTQIPNLYNTAATSFASESSSPFKFIVSFSDVIAMVGIVKPVTIVRIDPAIESVHG